MIAVMHANPLFPIDWASTPDYVMAIEVIASILRSSSMQLPDLYALGWVSFRKGLRQVEGAGYHEFVAAEPTFRSATDIMFRTGNPEPPDDAFSSRQSFNDFLRRREYRGAIGLWNAEITLTPGQLPGRIQAEGLDPTRGVGFTPLPIWKRLFLFPRFRWTYSGGDGEAVHPTFRWSDDGTQVAIRMYAYFRVGKIYRWIYKNLTGAKIPYARMEVFYVLDPTTLSTFAFSRGTVIPNQCVFITKSGKTVKAFAHDMMLISSQLIREFLACKTEYADVVPRSEVTTIPW